MKNFTLNTIGSINNNDKGFSIKLFDDYLPGITGLEDFSYINILWWADRHDNESDRANLSENNPYKGSPDILGTFATRSPKRPNPIGITTCYVTHIDKENKLIHLAFIDADDLTPVLDIKPYHPSSDTVLDPNMPEWAKAFPKSLEESADFDWSKVFNF
ncbi:SAM-dependent methyltransferase [Vagococcus fluvialis]|uniref:SAM-dependent methyltransferase n=1 Tax=Vagococcus fluvialis TaxID=2738 RepID=UPI00379C9A47